MPFDASVVRCQKIIDHFQEEIDLGNLRSGDPLPSGAEMARQFDCHRTTAYKAVKTLQERGYVISGPLGTVVAPPTRVWWRLRDILETLERRGENPTLLDGGGTSCIMGKSATVAWHPKDEVWQLEPPQ